MSFFTPDDDRIRRQAIADVKAEDADRVAILTKQCQDAAIVLLPDILQKMRQDYLAGERSSNVRYSGEAIYERFSIGYATHSPANIEQELRKLLIAKGLRVETTTSEWKQTIDLEINF